MKLTQEHTEKNQITFDETVDPYTFCVITRQAGAKTPNWISSHYVIILFRKTVPKLERRKCLKPIRTGFALDKLIRSGTG